MLDYILLLYSGNSLDEKHGTPLQLKKLTTFEDIMYGSKDKEQYRH